MKKNEKPKFMIIAKYYFIISISIVFICSTFSQVNVSLRPPPQYQFKVADFWKMTLNKTTQNAVKVCLYGIATRTSEGKIVDAKTKVYNNK